MAVQVTTLKREFKFEKDGETVTLPDPNPEFTLDEVLRYYSGQYPQLTTAALSGPKVEKNKAVYQVEENFGTHG